MATNTTTTTHQAQPTKPVLWLHPAVWQKMLALARKCNSEYSGLGLLEVLPGNRGFYCKEFIIPKQVCSGAETEFDAPALGQMIAAKMADDPEHGEEWNAGLKLWFHSHVDMGCYWSPVDTGQMQDFAAGGEWVVSLVLNRKGECRARYDTYTPLHMWVDDIPVHIDTMLTAEEEAELEALLKDRVTTKYTTTYNQGRGGNWSGTNLAGDHGGD